MVVKLAVLLLLVVATASAKVDLCSALRGLTAQAAAGAKAIDGVSGLGSDDLSWVFAKACADRGAASTAVDSGWVSAPKTLAFAPCGGPLSAAAVRRTAAAALSADAASVDAAVQLAFNFTCGGASVRGAVAFAVSALPLALSGRFAPPWEGSLRGAAADALFADGDLFDGLPAFVARGASPAQATDAQRSAAQAVARVAAAVNGRLRGFDAVPTALAGDVTARLAFAPSSLLAVPQAAAAAFAGGAVVAQPTAACRGSAECGAAMATALEAAAVAGADGRCTDPALVDAALAGKLTADVRFDEAGAVSVRAVRAVSQGVVRCAEGAVAVVLEAAQDLQAGEAASWPADALVTDTRAAISALKTLPVAVSGTRAAALQGADGSLVTAAPNNLFGRGRPGVFVTDRALTSADAPAFAAQLTQLASLLHTGVAALDSGVSSLLTPDVAAGLVDAYLELDPAPSVLGLWQFWATQVSGIELSIGDDLASAYAQIGVALRSQPLPYSASDPAFAAFSAALGGLATDLDSLCRAASGSCNFTAPVLEGASALKSSVIDGALEAIVSLPLDLASGKPSMLFPLEHWARAIVDASFAATSSATSAKMSFWYGASAASVDRAELNVEMPSSIQGPVARDAAGKLVQNTAWPRAVLQGLASQALHIQSLVNERESLAPASFASISESLPGVTHSSLLQSVHEFLAALPASAQSITDISEGLQARIKTILDPSGESGIIFSFEAIPDSTAGQVRIAIDVHGAHRFALETTGTSWESTVPLSRLGFLAPTSSRVEYTLTEHSSELVDCALGKGTGHAIGFALPVRSNMRAGLARGTATLVLDLPKVATMRVDVHGEMADTEKSGFELSFVGNLTAPDESSGALPESMYSFTFEEQLSASRSPNLQPATVMNAFTDLFTLPDEVARHRIASPVAPFQTPLSTFFSRLDDAWELENVWSFTGTDFPTLAFSADIESFPTAAASAEVNISVNGGAVAVSCPISIPAASNATELEAAFAAAFAACHPLDQYIAPMFVFTDEDDDDEENQGAAAGHLALVPAAPGLVYSMDLAAPSEFHMFASQLFVAPHTIPDSLSWNDFHRLVTFSLMSKDRAYSAPAVEMLSVDATATPLIDPSRARFYPEKVQACFFPIELSLSQQIKEVSTALAYSTADGSVQTALAPESGSLGLAVDANAKVDAEFGVALLCSLGQGNLDITTQFGASAGLINATFVPAAPNNTFVLAVEAEVRNASTRNAAPERVRLDQTISLKPGALVAESLLQDVAGQLGPILARMVRIEPKQPSFIARLAGMPEQLIVSAWPATPSDAEPDTLYIPAILSITDSHVPAIGNAEGGVKATALTTCPLARNLEVGLSVDSSDATAEIPCTGSVGLVDVSSCKASVSASQRFAVKALETVQYTSVLLAAVLDSETFEAHFDGTASTTASVRASKLEFDVSKNTMSDLSAQALQLSQKRDVPLINITTGGTAYIATVDGSGASAAALTRLTYTSRAHICELLRMSDTASNSFAEHNHATTKLPFTDTKLGPLFDDAVRKQLDNAIDTICRASASSNVITDDGDAGDPITLGPVCKVLDQAWNVRACAESAVSDDDLMLYVVAQPPPVHAEASFVFDTARLTGKNGATPGVGTSGDFSVMANLSAGFGLVLHFEHSAPYVTVELDTTRTKFGASAYLDADARLKAAFGSAVISFATADVHLDAQLQGHVASGAKVSADIDGSAAFKATAGFQTLFSCELDVSVASLADFFSGRANATFRERCGSGEYFVDDLQAALDAMTFASYFAQDPSLFWKQFSSSLESQFFDALIKKLLNVGVAFLGKEIQRVVRDALDKIDGPEVAQLVGKEVADMVANVILHHHYPNRTELDQIVLDVFTGILNKQFAKILVSPIPTPRAGTEPYRWEMRFGQTQVRPLPRLAFDLGKHGPAELALTCTPDLVLRWRANVDLLFSRDKGVWVEFPVNPAFEGGVTLESGSCDMKGHILVLAAELSATATVDGKIAAIPVGEGKIPKALEFKVDAELQGMTELGLVGILKKKTSENPYDSLPALPHLKAGISASWVFDYITGQKATTPHLWQWQEPQVCLGTLLVKLLRRVAEEVDKVIKPLDPVFGPNGILLKPIPGFEKVFGGDCNVLHIVELACKFHSDHCNLDKVEKLIKVLNEIAETIGVIEKWEQWLGDDEGCADIALIFKTFNVNWTKTNPQPEYPADVLLLLPENGEDTGKLVFGPTVSTEAQEEVTDALQGWRTEGKFGIHLDILDHLPQKVIEILLGGNVALISLTFPSATFTFSRDWEVPVWGPFPEVDIVIAAGASLALAPPPIVLTSDAIADSVRTRNPSLLFTELALPTLLDSGQPRWVVNGWLEVSGGGAISVGVYFAKVKGEATLYVRLNAAGRPVNLEGGNLVTFDQLALQYRAYGLRGTVDLELSLKGGLRLALKACINLLFTKKCWTIASVHWDKTFVSWNSLPDHIPLISTGDGTINGDAVSWRSKPSDSWDELATDDVVAEFTFTASGVALLPVDSKEAGPALTRKLHIPAGKDMRFTGNPCAKSLLRLTVSGDIANTIQVPSCDNVDLVLEQDGFTSSFQYTLGAASVTPDGRAPIAVSGNCHAVSLTRPLSDAETAYAVTGLPRCPVSLETDHGSGVSLTGSPAESYRGVPLTITGMASSVDCTAQCTNYTVGPASLTCDNSALSVAVPLALPAMTISAPPMKAASRFVVTGVPSGREVTLTGSSLGSVFVIADMRTLNGSTTLVGNSAGAATNRLEATLRPESGKDMHATASPQLLAVGDRLLKHVNVNRRTYSVFADAGHTSTFTLLAPADFDIVRINHTGVANSKAVYEVTGCEAQSEVVVQIDGAGDNTVVIGNIEGLQQSLCTIQIHGSSATQNNTIFINATTDPRALRWEFNHGGFTVSSASGSQPLLVFFEGVKRVAVHFNSAANEVKLNTGTLGTEYALSFAPTPKPQSSLHLFRTTDAVLVNGSLAVLHIGPDAPATAQEQGCNPFSGVLGALGVAGTVSKIVLDSADGPLAPAQHFTMDANCLNATDIARPAEPSAWMREQLVANSLPAALAEKCSMIFKLDAKTSQIQLTTGGAEDSLVASGASLPVVADLGDGNDRVSWMDVSQDVKLSLNLGLGADTLAIRNTGHVEADLGDDDVTDDVSVFYSSASPSPSIKGSTIAPTGSFADSALEIGNWKVQDLVSILRRDSKKQQQQQQPLRGDPVEVQVTVPGAYLYYEMHNDTTYHLTKCANDARVAFGAENSDQAETSIVEGAWVYAVLEDPSVPCTILLNNVHGHAGVAGFVFPEAPAPLSEPQQIVVKQTSSPQYSGTCDVGHVQMRLEGVDHFLLDIPNSHTEGGSASIDGTPAGADLLFKAPAAGWQLEVLRSAADIVVLGGGVAATVDSALLDSAMPPAILYFSGNGSATVQLDATASPQLRLIAGELTNTNGAPRDHALSEWIVNAAKEHGYTIPSGRELSAAVQLVGVQQTTIKSVSEAAIGSLSTATTRSVAVSGASPKLVLEPAPTKTNSAAPVVSWKSAAIKDGRIDVNLADGDSFTVSLSPSSAVSLGSAVLVPGCPVSIDCASSATPSYNWDLSKLAGSSFGEDAHMRALLTFNGSACAGAISNAVSSATSHTPSVSLGPSLNAAAHVAFSAADPAASAVDRTIAVFADPATGRTDLKVTVGSNAADAAVVAFAWSTEKTLSVDLAVSDPSRNVLLATTDTAHTLDVQAGEAAAFAFAGSSERTLVFSDARPTQYVAGTRSLTAVPNGPGFCFDPCKDCDDSTWTGIRLSGEPCHSRTDSEACNSNAHIRFHISAESSALGLMCGAAQWASAAGNDTCSLVLNAAAGTPAGVSLDTRLQMAVSVGVGLTALLTVVGATTAVSALVCSLRSKKRVPGLGGWWARNTFRDLLVDQFSWAPYVLTACLASAAVPEAWSPQILTLITEAKRFVLDWFTACNETTGMPATLPPAMIVFWCVAAVAVSLRVLDIVLIRRREHERQFSQRLRNTTLAMQSVTTTLGVLFLPLVAHALAFSSHTSVPAFVSAGVAALLLLSQPVSGPSSRQCVAGVLSSAVVVLLPALTCFITSFGSHLSVTMALALAATVLMPFASAFVLWTTFFSRSIARGKKWLAALIATFSLRLLATFCGVAFFLLLWLGPAHPHLVSGHAPVAMWLLWVWLPFFSTIPLVMLASDVQRGDKVALASAAAPLLGSSSQDDGDPVNALRRPLLSPKRGNVRSLCSTASTGTMASASEHPEVAH